MFGYVMANVSELTKAQRDRYTAVYCGICRRIRQQCANRARLGLSYDMAFLSLLLMSLYEPEEESGKHACMLHPGRSWVDNEFIRYGADMNVALGYYNCMDDYADEGKKTAKKMAEVFAVALPRIKEAYPRQCQTIEEQLDRLHRLEQENCPNPDASAACFGSLLGELFVYREDQWANNLRQMGMALGRYIYLADAAVDYRRDRRRKQYNPFLAMGTGEDWTRWERYLVLAMGRCTDYFERLPPGRGQKDPGQYPLQRRVAGVQKTGQKGPGGSRCVILIRCWASVPAPAMKKSKRHTAALPSSTTRTEIRGMRRLPGRCRRSTLPTSRSRTRMPTGALSSKAAATIPLGAHGSSGNISRPDRSSI